MNYLESTAYLNYNSPEIQAIVAEFTEGNLSELERAKAIYLKIRDGWRYNPYLISVDRGNYVASEIAKKPEGHCVDKAILLIACLRAVGIPARIRLAKVTNHIAVERLTERFGTNVLTPHGMVDVFLDNKWVKATPAFNKELCELCNVAPLEFDGENDSMFQEFNEDGKQFMEYLEDYGPFEDVPLDFMLRNLQENYPDIFNLGNGVIDYKF
ncbi:MAG: transglutaminase-like domain-containing protein [Bacteroidota bacterium]